MKVSKSILNPNILDLSGWRKKTPKAATPLVVWCYERWREGWTRTSHLAWSYVAERVFKTIPPVSPLVNLVLETMAERQIRWHDFPEWCKNTGNPTYRLIYKKIDNKFRHSVQYVNEEIERMRLQELMKDHESRVSLQSLQSSPEDVRSMIATKCENYDPASEESTHSMTNLLQPVFAD